LSRLATTAERAIASGARRYIRLGHWALKQGID